MIRWIKMLKIFKKTILLSIIIWVLFFSDAFAEEEIMEGHFTVVEEKTGKMIFMTSMYVHVGDQFLDENNRLYEVKRIDGKKGYADFKEKIDLGNLFTAEGLLAKYGIRTNQKIGVYFTHNDESYEPTDGSETIQGRGGIHKVGKILAAVLEKKGIQAIVSDNIHLPHDAAAYKRSRRTATSLLKKGLDALIDVHRDGIPSSEYYAEKVGGQWVTQIKLVVGRQNPQRQVNDNFAKQLKAAADKLYPGLIKGIFYAKGNYNQDLAPRSILVEVGTFKNHRESAERGVALFGNVVTAALYGEDALKNKGPGGTAAPIEGESSSTIKSLLLIMLLTVIAAVLYVVISGGSWEEIKSKINKFAKEEFANLLGRKKNKE